MNVGFPYAGWWKERGKGKGEGCPLREGEISPRSSRGPSYILEVSVAGPLDLACLKRPLPDICVNKQWATLTSYRSPNGQCLTPLHEGFFFLLFYYLYVHTRLGSFCTRVLKCHADCMLTQLLEHMHWAKRLIPKGTGKMKR
jgi:hypothetical protein